MFSKKIKEKKKKERKEITKVSGPLKLVLKYMFKKYGYVKSIETINLLQSATVNEKELMLAYLQELNNK